MRRGGRLYLLIGILVAVLAMLGLIYYMQISSPGGGQAEVVAPTAVPRKQVVTARIDIPSGTVLVDTGSLEQFLTTEDIPETDYNANPGRYFTSVSELLNKVTIRDIPALEVVMSDAVAETGLSFQIPEAADGQPRPKAFPLQVTNISGVVDQLAVGDVVDVLASFDVARTSLQPSYPPVDMEQPEGSPPVTAVYESRDFSGQSTKTLLQNVRVLKIVKSSTPTGTPSPETTQSDTQQGPPQTDANGQPIQATAVSGSPGTYVEGAQWWLLLAVTDQQAEVLKYAVERGTGITLVLRGRGDDAPETTLGITLDILIAYYGLPLPAPIAPVIGPISQLTPAPATAVPATITP